MATKIGKGSKGGIKEHPALAAVRNSSTVKVKVACSDIDGMATMGFRPFLRPEIQAPIIVTFHAPADPRYEFKRFYEGAKARGFVLYPGKLTQLETFRVGCIGAIGHNEMKQAVDAVADTLREMGIASGAPAL